MFSKVRPTLILLSVAAVFGGLIIAGCGGDDSAPAATAVHTTANHTQGADHQLALSTNTEKVRDKTTAAILHDDMRKLWEDHITWTRLFIISDAGDLPDLNATTARLLQNQTDLGDAIKPFYGDAAGTQLTALLRQHILTAADILAAAKAGDQATTAAEIARWYANGDEIAAFLTSANPANWSITDTEMMMKDHLDLTLEEAVARLSGHYQEDIAAYDKVHVEILSMADMLSAGIVAQFPAKFR